MSLCSLPTFPDESRLPEIIQAMRLLQRLPEFMSFVTDNVRTNFLEPLLQQAASEPLVGPLGQSDPTSSSLAGEKGETACASALEVEVSEREHEERVTLSEQGEGEAGEREEGGGIEEVLEEDSLHCCLSGNRVVS